MNHRRLLLQMFGLTLIALLLAGCSGGRTEPTPTKQPTRTPTPTEIVNKVTVVYRDGQKMDIEDWSFLYRFGWGETEPQEAFVYQLKDLSEVSSKDLHLQTETITGSGTLTEEIVITANELERIKYTQYTTLWIEILTKSGKEYRSPRDSLSASDLFLSPGHWVYAKTLFLVGWVRQDGQRINFKQDLFLWMTKTPKEIIFP